MARGVAKKEHAASGPLFGETNIASPCHGVPYTTIGSRSVRITTRSSLSTVRPGMPAHSRANVDLPAPDWPANTYARPAASSRPHP